jgi:hypothetical protein
MHRCGMFSSLRGEAHVVQATWSCNDWVTTLHYWYLGMDELVHSPSVGLGLEGVWGWLLMDGGSYFNCRKPHAVNSVVLFRRWWLGYNMEAPRLESGAA